MLSRRAAIPIDERNRISRLLTEKFLASEIYCASKILMAYASTADELQLTELFAACFADQKILAIPFIVSKGEMLPVVVANFDSLELGAFNIPTVRAPRNFVDPAQIDCVIVPGAAFDLDGGRLGLGGGFYDRFLPRTVNATKIALAYDFQIVDEVPVEIHDAPVDFILTEKIFWRCKTNEVL